MHYAADFTGPAPVINEPAPVISGGYYMLSQIVFSKLSIEMQKALINESKSCYPTFDQIFDLSNNVINIINKTRKQKPNETGSGVKKSSVTTSPVNNSTLNFTTTNSNVPADSNVSGGAKVLHCRF